MQLEIQASAAATPLLPPNLDLDRLLALAEKALPLCLAAAPGPGTALHHLETLEITLVTDAEIAQVHAAFLDDPTPTDVITFDHGEILISVETAARQSIEHGQGQPVPREIALYLVHGLLHLAGWDDHDPAAAAAMAQRQENILAAAD